MLISLLTLLIISNALTLRKDQSILFSRVVMVSLIHTSFIAYSTLAFFFKWLCIRLSIILAELDLVCNIQKNEKENSEKVNFNPGNIVLSSSLSITISILTLILLLFIFIPNELFTLANIATIILFKP